MLKRLSIADSAEDITSEFIESGAVIVEGFLSPDVVKRLNDEVDPLVDVAESKGFVNEGLAYFFRDHTRNVNRMSQRSDTFVNEVLIHPLYEKMMERILLPNCNSAQLNTAIVFERGPGSEGQVLHRDEGNWDRTTPTSYQYHFGSLIALRNFTERNGATLVVPGSHHWPEDREAQPDEIVAAEMEPGSAVFYLGSTLHMAASNRSPDQSRRGLHVSYCLGWIRPEENHFLSTSMDRVRAMPEKAQALLGYASHDRYPRFGGGYSGAVDMRNPQDMLRAGEL